MISASSRQSASHGRARRWMALLSLLASVICVAAVSASQSIVTQQNLPVAWRNWLYSREVNLTNIGVSGLVGVLVPDGVYARSANHLADIRIVDDDGREVPFILDVPHGDTHSQRRGVRTREQSFVPGEFTQVVLDLGENPQFHDAILVNTPETDFMVWVEVAVSDDARQWRIVCDRAPLFRFSLQNLQGTQTLRYSETGARYIRLRFLDGSKRFNVSAVQVLYEINSPLQYMPISAIVSPVASANAGESAWEADLPVALPVNAVRVDTEEPEFSRSVTIEFSENRSDWAAAGRGEIYRFHRDDVLREWLLVGFSSNWSAHWRVRVSNGNNAALAADRITLYITPRRLVFRAGPSRRYFVLYGQSQAREAQYDLARTISVKEFSKLPAATLGPEVVNASYQDPRPWTERHPGALWIAVILAVGLLGFAALRSLRASPRS